MTGQLGDRPKGRRGKPRLPVRVPGGRDAYAIRASPEEKPRLPKKTGPEADSVRPLKSPVSPSAPTRNVAFGSALAATKPTEPPN